MSIKKVKELTSLYDWAKTIITYFYESGEMAGHDFESWMDIVDECMERKSLLQMRILVGDVKEFAMDMDSKNLIGLNRILREKFGEDLSSRMARSMAAVLRRGKIRNDDEFVRVNEWIDHLLYDRDNPDAEQQIEQYNQMLRDYEEKAARRMK